MLYTVVLLYTACSSVTHNILILSMKRSVSHLGSGVDIGPCLEQYPHHTGVTFVGCYHQSSSPFL